MRTSVSKQRRRRVRFGFHTAALFFALQVAAAVAAKRMPEQFRQYASVEVEHGSKCVVGASEDQDAMNQRPTVILRSRSGEVTWVTRVALPGYSDQGRATHCIGVGSDLYVLLQEDTHPSMSLNQTFLRVARLNRTGAVTGVVEVPHEGEGHPFTSWAHGDGAIRLSGDALVVTGEFREKDAYDDIPFSSRVRLDSFKSGGAP